MEAAKVTSMILLCCFGGLVRCAAEPVSERLIGWWKMDEAPGAGVLADSSGHERHATVGSGVSMVSGKFNNCALFDGSGDGWARFTSNTSLTNFTLVAWVKPNSFVNSYPKIFQLSRLYYQFRTDQPGRFSLGFSGSVRADWLSYGTDPFIVQTNFWTHAAVVYRRIYTNESEWVAQPTFYMNGIRCGGPQPQIAHSSETIGGGNIYLGNNSTDGNGTRGFDGAMDDVRIYNQALSDQDILELYYNSPVSVDAGMNQQCCRDQTTLQGSIASSHSFSAAIAAATEWSTVSAPAGASPVFEHPWLASTRVTLPQEGEYTFRLTAVSELGIVSNLVSVTRDDSAATGNQAPLVTPIVGSLSSVLGGGAQIAADVTDDGNPGSLQLRWRKVSGPGGVFFDEPFAAATTAWFTTNGVYVLSLTADDGDKTDSSDVTVTVNLPAGDLNDGLIHWWQMDENPDMSETSDSAGDNNLALVNQAVLQPAKTGYGMRFPAPNSYALADTIFTNAECFTFSLWMYYDAAYTNNIGKRIFDYGNSRFYMYFSPDHVYLATKNLSDTKDFSWRQQSYSLEDDRDQWIHLTVLYDRRPSAVAGKTQGFYINGVATGSSALTSAFDGSKAFTTGNFYIGGNPWGRNFDGVFDDMRVYDRLLSEEEIRLLAVDPDNNHAPIIEAPSELAIPAGSTAESTVKVFDDARPLGGTLTTTWSVVTGNAANIDFSDSTSPNSSITVTRSGTYTLRLTATDGERSSAVDITLTSNPTGTALLIR